jgi:hypothetical protein
LIGSGSALIEKAICHFDDKGQGAVRAIITPAVPAVCIRTFSPPSSEDGDPNKTASDLNQLDFALIELERDFADEPIVESGEARGFLKILDGTGFPQINEPVFIFQHPKGERMKVDVGMVKSVGLSRFRYTANTLKGSSGSPIFDAALNVVGIHHAGYPCASEGPINQGVPIALIRKFSQDRSVAL